MRSKSRFGAGYTLVELIVAVGLFAFVMLLASGAYLIVIGANRQTQGIATGIDNLAFALETMTRTIRTGKDYSCNSAGDCSAGGTSFSVTDINDISQTYTLTNGAITQNGVPLTDASVNVSSLTFYAIGTAPGDTYQPHVTIVAAGSVSYAAGKTESFTVQTGATMRTSDL